ncbi:hypothetical protein BKA70DRAFT_1491424 [Coprinopsis sp. MPI-PUGE-AT-0042]|nr:hypothetical protein BKA70DRAFT_1491424 [Coprinopsis sp. MPI-PUGE-AT-0042]
MDNNPNRPSFREDRIAIVVTYLFTSLWGAQCCLSVHALTQLYISPIEKKSGRICYAVLLGVVMILSTFPFVLFVREPYVPLIDSKSYHELSNAVGTANEGAFLVSSKVLLALVGNGFMAWRATTIWNVNRFVKWMASAAYLFYTGVCILSVAFQVHALRSLEASAPVIDFEQGYSWSLGDSPINPMLQGIFRQWRAVEFSASVGFNAILAVLICARFISTTKSQGPRTRRWAALFEPVTYRRWIIALLNSALPFTLLGIAGLLSRGQINSENYGAYTGIDINNLMHTLWNQVLALGTQVMLFRILSGTEVA